MSKVFMRLLVFFDLPVKTARERKIYSTFRKSLIKEGYYMIQYSVYGRICNGVDAVKKHQSRLERITPTNGSVRILAITEKQYASIIIVAGEKKFEDVPVNNMQLSFF